MSDFEFARKAVVSACVVVCVTMAAGLSVETAQAQTKVPVVKPAAATAAKVQLPDGRWLEAGGAGKAESTASIVGADGRRTPLATKLAVARQGHSLTVLADG
ncbi:MAG TPA: hypothetical protein VFY73_12185, partial [Ideonella sp.]|uniref:hypothetical protein n=1 Tax=Ideonella sp. TaxID=1929293 RepID=UPI002E3739FF